MYFKLAFIKKNQKSKITRDKFIAPQQVYEHLKKVLLEGILKAVKFELIYCVGSDLGPFVASFLKACVVIRLFEFILMNGQQKGRGQDFQSLEIFTL